MAVRHEREVHLVEIAPHGDIQRDVLEPLFAGTHPVTAFYSVANIFEDMPLNMTVRSYLDQMNFSLLASPKQIPDLWEITDGIREALALLVKAASGTD